MATNVTIQVAEQDRDRFARVAHINVNGKKIRTPCFATQIENRYELDIFHDLKENYSPEGLDAFVIRYFDAPSVLRRVQPEVRNDILGRVREDKYTLFMKNQLLIIDPMTECLFYEGEVDHFSVNHETPRCIIEHASKVKNEKRNKDPKTNWQKLREKLHVEFWKSIVEDTAKKMNFVKSFLGYEHQCGASVLMPPAPLIYSDETLNIAIEINNIAKGIAQIYKKPCATYLNVKNTMLKSDELMAKIKMAVYENASKSLTAFKFKNLDLALPRLQIPRENYRDLGMELSYFSQELKDRAVMVLENSCQCFASPFVGFDFVSASFTMYSGGVATYEHPPYGNYFDPVDKIHIPFDEVAESYDTIGRLKCPCRGCKDVKVKHLREFSPHEWNVQRRIHVPMYLDYWMECVKKAVKDKNTELVRDNFSNSKVSNLKDLLP
jgi:hypothetical protein